jgi:hypothetical protein
VILISLKQCISWCKWNNCNTEMHGETVKIVRLCIIIAWWCLLTCCHLNHPNYWNPPGSALWSVGTSCVWPNLAPLCYHFNSLKLPYVAINFLKTDMWRNLPTGTAVQPRTFYLYVYRSVLTTRLSSWKSWETY